MKPTPGPWAAEDDSGKGYRFAIRHHLKDRPNAAYRIATVYDLASADEPQTETQANAALIAAAGTAAHACEERGYDGMACVEALAELLNALAKARDALDLTAQWAAEDLKLKGTAQGLIHDRDQANVLLTKLRTAPGAGEG